MINILSFAGRLCVNQTRKASPLEVDPPQPSTSRSECSTGDEVADVQPSTSRATCHTGRASDTGEKNEESSGANASSAVAESVDRIQEAFDTHFAHDTVKFWLLRRPSVELNMPILQHTLQAETVSQIAKHFTIEEIVIFNRWFINYQGQNWPQRHFEDGFLTNCCRQLVAGYLHFNMRDQSSKMTEDERQHFVKRDGTSKVLEKVSFIAFNLRQFLDNNQTALLFKTMRGYPPDKKQVRALLFVIEFHVTRILVENSLGVKPLFSKMTWFSLPEKFKWINDFVADATDKTIPNDFVIDTVEDSVLMQQKCYRSVNQIRKRRQTSGMIPTNAVGNKTEFWTYDPEVNDCIFLN